MLKTVDLKIVYQRSKIKMWFCLLGAPQFAYIQCNTLHKWARVTGKTQQSLHRDVQCTHRANLIFISTTDSFLDGLIRWAKQWVPWSCLCICERDIQWGCTNRHAAFYRGDAIFCNLYRCHFHRVILVSPQYFFYIVYSISEYCIQDNEEQLLFSANNSVVWVITKSR